MKKEGATLLEARTNAGKRQINHNFTNAQGYYKAKIYELYGEEGKELDIVVKSTTSGLEKHILLRPDTHIPVGAYISYNKKNYIVRELDTDQITPKALAFLCNRELNFKGVEYAIPCYTNSTTYGSKGILDQDKFYELDSKTKIFIQSNPITQKLEIGQRVMFANKYVYKITEIDDLVFPNMLTIVAQRDEALPMDDFENNLAWNTYDATTEKKDSRTFAITGGDKFKLHETHTYTFPTSVQWKIDDPTIATIVEQSNQFVKLQGIKRGWVTLSAVFSEDKIYTKEIMIS